MTFKTADLCDEHADKVQICYPLFSNYGGRARFFGRVSTIKCFEDNSRVREAVAEPGRGRVLVVDAGGSQRCAMLGDMLAANAVKNGWAGVIVNGLVRDTADTREMDLGILALGTHPLKSIKKGIGERDVDVTFAGVRFAPGNHVYADEDGILCSEAALL